MANWKQNDLCRKECVRKADFEDTIALSEIDYARRIGRRNAGTRPVVVRLTTVSKKKKSS